MEDTDQVKNSIFTPPERKLIINSERRDRSHPLKRILFPSERDEQVAINTNIEVIMRYIEENHPQWFSKLKKRLLNSKDYSDSSSALSEIRAFGDLLKCGVSVKPVPENKFKKTTDFVVSNENQQVFIEVNAKQNNNEEAKNLNEFFKNSPNNPGRNYTTQSHEIVVAEYIDTPFGKPTKPGENVTANFISKIASIKENEAQFEEDSPSILWLDFQDEIWDMFPLAKAVLPVVSSNGAFYSGGIWYAFYGWKDAPIFEHNSIDIFYHLEKMQHPGRFENQTKIDAAILSFERNIVILENPSTKKPVSPSLWKQICSHQWFNFEDSYMNWPSQDLPQRIELEKNKIRSIAKEIEVEEVVVEVEEDTI